MPSSTFEPDTLFAEDELERVPQGRPIAPVRVLQVIPGEHYSGAERVQDLLASNLAEFGFEVGFACLKPGRFDQMRQAKRAPLVKLRMKSRFDLFTAWRLARLIVDQRYALVHTYTPRGALVGRLACILAGVPQVHHVQSPTTSDSTRVRRDRFNALVERLSLAGVSGVIAASHSLADYARNQGIAPARISVVHNGVPARGPLVDRRPPGQIWTLGVVALFRPRKGLEVLLESLAVLRCQGISVKLRAVGAFETVAYERKIKEKVARLKIADLIQWVGFTQDVPSELAQMDLFVLPSLFGEGLPLVILEAMAAGVPVVGTRIEGVPEAVRDGQDGLIAAPNDPQDLARAIARFVRGEADWSRLRASAHRRQAECFSARSMALGIAGVYQQVLGRTV
ncbi:MAG: glycosyltransferase [Planctomycetia bacterium]|nr:glycosyltransferase [Planctomycetia bacterium]